MKRGGDAVTASTSRYVLDSFALLAHLQDEPGAARVRAVLEAGAQARAELYLSVVNFGEVIYIIEREKGLPAAQRVIAAVDQLPLTVVEADRALTLAAAHLKVQHPIAYADAFAAALAQSRDAILLTGDPEMKAVQAQVRVE
ncbi:MAG: type II toxin-antitoxin system VapC family toxin [Anaerolineae bacterium]